MNSLAHALRQLPKDSELGKMVSKVVIKTKVVRKQKTKVAATPAVRFTNSILKTATGGVGSLRPCSLLTWKPGRPVQSNGNSGRVKWGLSDGKLEFVVMVFDCAQSLYGTDSKVEYGLVHVSTLTRCDCAGYLHGKHCEPTIRFNSVG